ncbi:MAG: redoxin domain-containing protein [Candidatus Falkowbacteria bacterium]|nr:redoxin domain-containing protein [Candidatus Falkowbacteria bacterium]
MFKIGQVIPNIQMEMFQKEAFKKINTDDYRGKWLVIVFYPADFTFICPTELTELANYYADFQAENTEIISVSTDTVFAHKAWHDESPMIAKIQYPMAADPTGNICRAFGTYIEEEGLSLRGTFIIDPQGVLKVIDIHDNSIGRSSKEILRRLQAAKFVNENAGLVCPASWEKGKDTLKPGIDLVGKI